MIILFLYAGCSGSMLQIAYCVIRRRDINNSTAGVTTEAWLWSSWEITYQSGCGKTDALFQEVLPVVCLFCSING